MADDPATAPPHPAAGCTLFALIGVGLFAAFAAAVLAGVELSDWARRRNLPFVLQLALFFAPAVVLGTVVWRVLAAYGRRWAARRPSPEQVAVAARGEGVEAGTTPTRRGLPPDALPTVRVAETAPGTVLAHRLAPAGVPRGCLFLGVVGAAVFWNAIVGLFVSGVVGRWGQFGPFGWCEAAFLVPFVLIGVALVGGVFVTGFRWFVGRLVGRVEVELDDHPLAPARPPRLHAAQVGPFPLDGVTVALVCTEEATYLAGTSKTTVKKEVAEYPLGRAGELPAGFPFTPPADAMHSFDAPNNKIVWTVRVAGRVLGLPFSADFSATVVPPPEQP